MKKIELLWQCFNEWNDRKVKRIIVKIWLKKFWFEIMDYNENEYTKASDADFIIARDLIRRASEKYRSLSKEIKKKKKIHELSYIL